MESTRKQHVTLNLTATDDSGIEGISAQFSARIQEMLVLHRQEDEFLDVVLNFSQPTRRSMWCLLRAKLLSEFLRLRFLTSMELI